MVSPEPKASCVAGAMRGAQVIHYLRATRIPYALLINFGRPQLQYDTFELSKLPSASVLSGSGVEPQLKNAIGEISDG